MEKSEIVQNTKPEKPAKQTTDPTQTNQENLSVNNQTNLSKTDQKYTSEKFLQQLDSYNVSIVENPTRLNNLKSQTGTRNTSKDKNLQKGKINLHKKADFNLSGYTNHNPKEYDPLKDKNLKQYFHNDKVKKQLQKNYQIDRKGYIVQNPNEQERERKRVSKGQNYMNSKMSSKLNSRANSQVITNMYTRKDELSKGKSETSSDKKSRPSSQIKPKKQFLITSKKEVYDNLLIQNIDTYKRNTRNNSKGRISGNKQRMTSAHCKKANADRNSPTKLYVINNMSKNLKTINDETDYTDEINDSMSKSKYKKFIDEVERSYENSRNPSIDKP